MVTIEVKLSKVGNSLKITVPIEVIRALKWKVGDKLEVDITDHAMIVKKSP